MSLSCDVVMDLVSLYHDGVASVASERAVREHLEYCDECRAYYKRYRSIAPSYQEIAQDNRREYVELAKRMRIRRLWMSVGILAYVSASICAVLMLWQHLRQK